MMLRSSGGDRPGLRSTSRPRRRKMSTAAGDSLSLIRTLGMRTLVVQIECRFPPPLGGELGGGGLLENLRVRPLQPRQQGLDVCGLNGCATPDTQPRGRIAIRTDIEGHA